MNLESLKNCMYVSYEVSVHGFFLFKTLWFKDKLPVAIDPCSCFIEGAIGTYSKSF